MVESKATTPKPAEKPEEKPTAQPEAATGLAAEVQAQHVARTTVPGRPGVDARFDNRSVEDLAPPKLYGPDDPKPQSVPGPDAASQVAHTAAVLAKRKKG